MILILHTARISCVESVALVARMRKMVNIELNSEVKKAVLLFRLVGACDMKLTRVTFVLFFYPMFVIVFTKC